MCADMFRVVERLDRIVTELEREHKNRADDMQICDVPVDNPLHMLIERLKTSKDFVAAGVQLLRHDYSELVK